jgi:uncharacterized protein (TIGR02147 family)
MQSESIQFLNQEFKRRLAKNPSYSLRAFANALAISPGRLSELLSGKRKLTNKMAARLADRLSLDVIGRNKFFAAIDAAYATKPIAEEEFTLISEWYHFAILSLIETKGFKFEPKWIAQRLGITTVEVREAIERLERLQLIESRQQKIYLRQKGTATTSDVPSGALRRHHKCHIERAAQALEDVPLSERDITAITMAIDKSKLPQAKELIRKFRRQMSRLLESGERTEVYNLNIQLIPLSKNSQEKK